MKTLSCIADVLCKDTLKTQTKMFFEIKFAWKQAHLSVIVVREHLKWFFGTRKIIIEKTATRADTKNNIGVRLSIATVNFVIQFTFWLALTIFFVFFLPSRSLLLF